MPAALFRDNIRDRLDALPLPAGGPSPALLASAAVLLPLLFAFTVGRLRLGTPEEHASRCLAAMVAKDCRLFHAQLAGVLVGYFDAKLSLRSTRLPSAEIAGEFRRSGVQSGQSAKR